MNLVIVLLFGFVLSTQAQGGVVPSATADPAMESSCLGAGAIVTTVILTLLIAACLLAGGYYAWLKYWKPRRERHLILETDPERGGHSEYAFDNPGFKDAALTPTASTIEKTDKSKLDSSNKSRWSQWSPLGVLTLKNEKRRTVDDNEIKKNDVKIVSLRSHDFTGLGFNICGNMKEGIFIKDLLHRGPASASGKLLAGDRIRSLTINFEHMVFEDALTILSYASPYDVVIEVQGHTNKFNSGPFAQPRHPLYKSASSTDLLQIKSVRKSLFCQDDSCDRGSLSNLQKSLTRSFVPSFERNKSKSPKLAQENIRNSTNSEPVQNLQDEFRQQSNSTYHSKFGVKVLPIGDQILPSPTKTSELSQNDNSLNLEKATSLVLPGIENNVVILSIDEVDQKKVSTTPPPVKKREKNNKPAEEIKASSTDEEDAKFQRNNSGIKRDENGIPQEMPSHMLNAAVAARKNRKSQAEQVQEEVKKKAKGKAPNPPEESSKTVAELRYNSDSDLEELEESKSSVNTIELNSSDITVHQSSEDQATSEEKQNRKTASTGDLTKIVRTTKASSGTLERAQSLDITDNQPINSLIIKKAKNVDEPTDKLNDETLDDDDDDDSDKVKLSTMLNGLNTFQRNHLKKSTEWGNLEDAISNFSNEDFGNDLEESSGENMAHKALVDKINEIKLEADENVNEEIEKIEKEATELKNDIIKIEQAIKETNINKDKMLLGATNNIWPIELGQEEQDAIVVEAQNMMFIKNKLEEIIQEASEIVLKQEIPKLLEEQQVDENHHQLGRIVSMDFLTMERAACSEEFQLPILTTTNVSDDMKVSMGSLERSPNTKEDQNDEEEIVIIPTVEQFNITYSNNKIEPDQDDETLLFTEPELTLDNEMVDLSRINISNITIIDDPDEDYPLTKPADSFSVIHLNHDEKPLRLVERETSRILSTPDLIQNITIREAMNDVNNHAPPLDPVAHAPNHHVIFDRPLKPLKPLKPLNHQNHVTIEGPSSLSFEMIGQKSVDDLNGNSEHLSDPDGNSSSKHSSLTYITEIQVTPSILKRNVSEIEIIRDKNLDSEFENYVKNFDIKSSSLDNLDLQPDSLSLVNNEVTVSLDSNLDIQKEINKIQEIADQQLKKLPEMRFSSSSYESQYNRDVPAPKRHSQIEILRSNFEKVSLPRVSKDPSPPKSRIPVALTTTKTPPTSPERRDSRTDLEQPDKEIIEIMNNSNIPNFKFNPNKTIGNNNRNITVTSIRSNSKIPSGLPTFNSGSSSGSSSLNMRPPVAPRKSLDNGQLTDSYSTDSHHGNVTIVTNGGSQTADNNSSFKQWVFNPNDSTNNNNNTSVTNITVTQTKYEK